MKPTEQHLHGEQNKNSGSKEFRVPLRTWVVWIAIFGGTMVLVMLRDKMGPPGELLNQPQFQELVDAGRIVRATISYDPQNPALNEITGLYRKDDSDKAGVPFHLKVRLTARMEEKLLSSPQFQAHQPNTLLLSVVWSVLPFIIIAALIWFFFIRQIRRITRNSPSTSDLSAKAGDQLDRFDRILDKWEDQAKRMDAVLSKLEGR
jgi:ATP-dependent Zn protease